MLAVKMATLEGLLTRWVWVVDHATGMHVAAHGCMFNVGLHGFMQASCMQVPIPHSPTPPRRRIQALRSKETRLMQAAIQLQSAKEMLTACLVPASMLVLLAVHMRLHGGRLMPVSQLFYVLSLLQMHWGGFSDGGWHGVAEKQLLR